MKSLTYQTELNYGQGYGKVSHSHHVMEVRFPDSIPDSILITKIIEAIYEALKLFEWFNGYLNSTAMTALRSNPLDGTRFILFDARGLFGVLAALINGRYVPVRIWSQRSCCQVTGDTAGTHMLVGQRRWRCALKDSQTPYDQPRLVVSTEAYDQPRGWLNWIGLKAIGKKKQLEVWNSYLQNIASHLENRFHCSVAKSIQNGMNDVPGDNPWLPAEPYPGAEIL
jgi:hypothetical protein